MFKSLIELNKSNSWVIITTLYVLITYLGRYCSTRQDAHNVCMKIDDFHVPRRILGWMMVLKFWRLFF